MLAEGEDLVAVLGDEDRVLAEEWMEEGVLDRVLSRVGGRDGLETDRRTL